ncbi:GAF domain-containing sensor histidine kinase [Streptomyces sp. NBC_01803]|uniref:GAF domain-containing sensor histidine kinase n=1 Tax=Streptomyces sp. NBC_01803 TaxID=2975946 RepID=UPI002DDA4A62|nr:GAF domain-containing protein [Streptomyces sp. NBC_01803]WSA45340.1 GAF domain-containing protein [Streptomyces sp. NBC_01803]
MRQMPRLLRAMEAIGGDIAPEAVLERIVRTAAELARARYAALAVLNEDGDGVGRLVREGRDPVPDGDGPLIRMLLDGTRHGPPGQTAGTLLVPVPVHGVRFGVLQVTARTDGTGTGTGADGDFTDEDRQMLRILATEAGIAIGNARLHEAVRQQARWMDGSLELSTALLSADEDNTLAVVAEQARRLAEAVTSTVLEPAPGGDLEVVAASSVPAAEAARLLGSTVPADSPAARRVLDGEPVFVDDPAADPRLVTGLAQGQGPSMLLPLAADGTPLGALSLARPPGAAPYTVPERALATQFAQQAALALVVGRARRDREQLAVLEDRDRIARDLHDLVIQRLFAVGMTLESARRADPPDDVRDRIDTATRELDATIQEIRTAIFALQQQPDEAPTSLRTRVLRETGTAAQTLGFSPSVSFTGPVDALIGEGVARDLVAALREALSNAARHARASRVEVTVDAASGDAVRLTVTDDGVGVPADRARRSGLRNLARRAEALGGSADIGPGPGGTGTRVTWQVPR